MKSITVNGNEYKLEYSYDAAECKDCVQAMFNILSGANIIKRMANGAESGGEGVTEASVYIDGTMDSLSEIPHVVNIAFYAGLLENNALGADDAKKVLRAYMKENKKNYMDVYDELKSCMEDDGFFELSGLNRMLKTLGEAITNSVKETEEPATENQLKVVKETTTKKTTKKQTSTT